MVYVLTALGGLILGLAAGLSSAYWLSRMLTQQQVFLTQLLEKQDMIVKALLAPPVKAPSVPLAVRRRDDATVMRLQKLPGWQQHEEGAEAKG